MRGLFRFATTAKRVRREKAALSSGCEPHPASAPAGSNRIRLLAGQEAVHAQERRFDRPRRLIGATRLRGQQPAFTWSGRGSRAATGGETLGCPGLKVVLQLLSKGRRPGGLFGPCIPLSAHPPQRLAAGRCLLCRRFLSALGRLRKSHPPSEPMLTVGAAEHEIAGPLLASAASAGTQLRSGTRNRVARGGVGASGVASQPTSLRLIEA
jgi:hypothetical protein